MAERFHSDPSINDYLQAAERGDTAIVALLDSGVDVDAHEHGSATALLMASRNGDVATMRVLLERGAHPNPDGSRDYTALTYAIQRSLPRLRGQTGLPDARPMEMLLAAGAKPNMIDAVLANDLELVRVFLEGGADPDEGRRS